MPERRLPSLPPVAFILEYETDNSRQVMEDGKRTDKVDVIPLAIRLETPATKPILTKYQIERLPKDQDATEEVAHRAYGEIRQGGRAIAITLDTSIETTVRVPLDAKQQAFFTNYNEAAFQIYRRVPLNEQRKRSDAPEGTTGERTR